MRAEKWSPSKAASIPHVASPVVSLQQFPFLAASGPARHSARQGEVAESPPARGTQQGGRLRCGGMGRISTRAGRAVEADRAGDQVPIQSPPARGTQRSRLVRASMLTGELPASLPGVGMPRRSGCGCAWRWDSWVCLHHRWNAAPFRNAVARPPRPGAPEIQGRRACVLPAAKGFSPAPGAGRNTRLLGFEMYARPLPWSSSIAKGRIGVKMRRRPGQMGSGRQGRIAAGGKKLRAFAGAASCRRCGQAHAKRQLRARSERPRLRLAAGLARPGIIEATRVALGLTCAIADGMRILSLDVYSRYMDAVRTGGILHDAARERAALRLPSARKAPASRPVRHVQLLTGCAFCLWMSTVDIWTLCVPAESCATPPRSGQRCGCQAPALRPV